MKFESKTSLVRGQGSESGGVEYECPYCGETTPSRRLLRVHIGSIHREKVDDFTVRYRGGRTIPPHGVLSDLTPNRGKESDGRVDGLALVPRLEPSEQKERR